MKHGDTRLDECSCHLHGVGQSAKAHVAIRDYGSQEVPVVESDSFLLGVELPKLALALVLPLLRSEDFAHHRRNRIPWVVGVVHPGLAHLGVAT